MSLGSPDNPEDSVREGRLPTGVNILDTEVLKGVPEGSTIAVIGDPDSATELLLHSLAATGRRTEYISTHRPKIGIMDDIKRSSMNTVEDSKIEENVTIRDVRKETDGFGDTVRKSLSLVDNGNLIIDSFSSQYDKKESLDIARRIQIKTSRNGGLTYLYFVANDPRDLTRGEKEILHMVDGVFNVKSDIVGTDNVENTLYIGKLRGIDLPDNTQSLKYGRNVSIDPTSDIG